MRFWKFTGLALPLLLLLSIYIGNVRSAGLSYGIIASFVVQDDGESRAKIIYESTNEAGGVNPTTVVMPAYGKNIEFVSASFQDGQKVEADYNEESNSITLKLPPISQTKTSFTVEYVTDITETLGKTTIHNVPAPNYQDTTITAEKITITSSVDDYGKIIGPEPTTSYLNLGKHDVTWQNLESKINSGVGLIYGDSALTDVKFEKELKNDGFWWQTKSVVLPPDTNQQKVFVEEISPEPSEVKLDTDGNILVKYKLGPKQSVKFSAKAKVLINNIDYDLEDKTDGVDAIPQDLIDTYTQLNDTWADTEITPKNPNDSALNISRNIFNQIVKNTSIDKNTDPNFDSILTQANRLNGELRANKIPARTVLGKIMLNQDKGFVNHAWVEAFLPSVGWITLDPYLELLEDSFGSSDSRKIGLTINGKSPDSPLFESEIAQINYLDQEAPQMPEINPEVKSVKHMILPGISLHSVKVMMPPGVVVDGSAIGFDNQIKQLGSLAPLQTSTSRTMKFGPAAFSNTKIEYGILSDGQITNPKGPYDTTVSYVPMLVIVFVGILLFAIRIIRKNRKAKKPIAPTIDEPKKSEEITPEQISDSASNTEAVIKFVPKNRQKPENQGREHPSLTQKNKFHDVSSQNSPRPYTEGVKSGRISSINPRQPQQLTNEANKPQPKPPKLVQ